MTSPKNYLSTESDLHAVADRLSAAAKAHDLDTVRTFFSPDATVWLNFINAVQTLEVATQMMQALAATVKSFRYEDVRRFIIDGGFVEQHTMCGEGPDGKTFEAPTITIVKVRDDGKITSIEEYFDPAQLPLPR